MSDETFFDFGETGTSGEVSSPSVEPATENPASPEPAPAPQIDPERFAALEQRAQMQERFQNDLKALLGGQQPQKQGMSEEELQLLMIQKPNEFKSILKDEALNELRQEMAHERVVSEYREKHPELKAYESYINVEMQNAINEVYQREGRVMPLPEAIEKGIERFKSKFQSGLATAKQQEQGEAMKRLALNLDLGTGSQPTKTSAEAISTMSDEQFAAFRQQQVMKSYGY